MPGTNGAPARPTGSAWMKAQASAQLAERKKQAVVDAEVATSEATQAIQDLLVNLVEMNKRLLKAALFAADQTAKVVSLRAALRSEWERAEAAEARALDLEAQLLSAKAPSNGRAEPATN